MKLEPAQTQALKASLKKRSRSELKQVFALVRAHDDTTLLAALKPQPLRKRPRDALVRNLEQTLNPIMGPAAEKAEMLVEFMAKKHRRKLPGAPRGLGDAAKRLRLHFTDAQIEAAAQGLLGSLKKLYGDRQTVV